MTRVAVRGPVWANGTVPEGTVLGRPVGGGVKPLTPAEVATILSTLSSSTIGNLLTANQASVETSVSDWVTNGAQSLVRSTSSALRGSASILVTFSTQAWGIKAATASRVPVTPGQVYTLTAAFLTASGSRTMRVRIVWYQPDNLTTSAITIQSAGTPVSASTWSRASVTALAPADAGFADIRLEPVDTGSAGDSAYVDAIGFWAGAGGEWAMPGTPIVNLGRRVTHPNTDDVLVEAWDSTQNRWQVAHYDSGWRIVAAASLLNGWTTGGGIYLRRVNASVFIRLDNIKGASSIANPLSLPTGFQVYGPGSAVVRESALTGKPAWVFGAGATLVAYGGILDGTAWTSSHALNGTIVGNSIEALPTSLPGALVSSAPYN